MTPTCPDSGRRMIHDVLTAFGNSPARTAITTPGNGPVPTRAGSRLSTEHSRRLPGTPLPSPGH